MKACTVCEGIAVSIVMLNCYSLGANCVERFVNYQTWPLIPARYFKAYHRAQAPLIQAFIVVPLAVSLLLQLALLFFFRTLGIGAFAVWAMVTASIAGSLTTVFIQLPIHRKFDAHGYSPELMKRLLRTDWLRKIADLVRIAATLVMLKLLLKF